MVYIGYTSQILRKTIYIGLTPLLHYNGKAVPGTIIKRGNQTHAIVEGTKKQKMKKKIVQIHREAKRHCVKIIIKKLKN